MPAFSRIAVSGSKLALACLFVGGWERVAFATPWAFDHTVGSTRWTQPVTIYIPPHPTDPAAVGAIREAVAIWQRFLVANNVPVTLRSVELDAQGRDPDTQRPPDTEAVGSVLVSFSEAIEEPGNTRVFNEGPLAGPPARLTPDGRPIIANATGTHGGIELRNNLGTSLRAVTMHELGHALFLDHDARRDAVMQELLESYGHLESPGPHELQELRAIYAPANVALQASAIPLDDGWFRYDYQVAWLGGGPLALAQVWTGDAPVADPYAGPGWTPDLQGDWFTLRVAPDDDFDGHLDELDEELRFGFRARRPPIETLGWAGATLAVLGPDAVPEATAFAVWCAMVLILLSKSRGARI